MPTRIIIIFAILTLSSGVNAQGISSIEKHEIKLKECLMLGPKAKPCFQEILKRDLPPGNEGIHSIADQIGEFFVTWLDGDEVANIFRIKDRDVGGLILHREYIIEDSTASLILLQIYYRKMLGTWYLFKYNINSNTEVVNAALGV